MRIAMVSEHASPLAALGGADAGGQNVHVAALAGALALLGHDVVVHTRRDDPSLPTTVRVASGVTVHHVDAGPPVVIAKDELRPWMDDFAAQLRNEWDDVRPDVVHAHFWMSGLASLAAAASTIPVVQTFHALGAVKRRHQGAADTSPADRLAMEDMLIASVDHIVATCHDEAVELDRLGADPRRVTVIPCGVDLDLFRPGATSAPAGYGSASGVEASSPRRLLVVGRLVERKGVADVIHALAWLPEVELVIAGGPPLDSLDTDDDVRRLRRQAERHHVEDRVRFLGQVTRSALPALIRSADAVVCVPRYEPFGMVPLEAMACGVPVVVSAVGGLKESVIDGSTGVHVPPGDPRQLSRAIEGLLADPGWAHRLGSNGANRARRTYGWDAIGRSTEAMYRQVCTTTPAPSQA